MQPQNSLGHYTLIPPSTTLPSLHTLYQQQQQQQQHVQQHQLLQQQQYVQLQQIQQQQPTTQHSLQQDEKDKTNETFVFKLYRMVEDLSHQHLLCWSPSGNSFLVTNMTEFAKEVLPKYFKHSNFSSFVRQLNMYGFHKVNDAPRSPKNSQEQQMWEFMHTRFVRGHPEWLNDIKRKTQVSSPASRSPNSSDSEDAGLFRRDKNEFSHQFAAMQNLQTDLQERVAFLQNSLQQIVDELSETRRQAFLQKEAMKKFVDLIGIRELPPELQFLYEEEPRIAQPMVHPAIYVSNYEYPADEYRNQHHQFSHKTLCEGSLMPPTETSHKRTASFNAAISTPLPPSPFGSPLHSSPIAESLDMEIKQDHWQGNY